MRERGGPLPHEARTADCSRAPLSARAAAVRLRAPQGRVVQGVGWSKMRLGFAVFGGPSTGVVQNASQFDGFGRIQAISGRLRRILDQASGKTPDPPETQTHFGPPSNRATGPLSRKTPDNRAAVPQDPGPPDRRVTGRSNAPADSVEVPHCAPRLEHEELSRCHRYPATGDDPVVSR